MKRIGIILILCGLMTTAWGQHPFFPYVQKLLNYQIIRYQPTEAGYELDRGLFRQEAVGIALTFSGVTYSHSHTCQGKFEDVGVNLPNYWACRVIENAVEKGLVSTYEKKFRPEDSSTRAEALAMFLTAAGVPLKDNFDHHEYDSEATWWQKRVIGSAMDAGVISRTKPFRPNDDITRGEAFAIIHNLLEWKGK